MANLTKRENRHDKIHRSYDYQHLPITLNVNIAAAFKVTAGICRQVEAEQVIYWPPFCRLHKITSL